MIFGIFQEHKILERFSLRCVIFRLLNIFIALFFFFVSLLLSLNEYLVFSHLLDELLMAYIRVVLQILLQPFWIFIILFFGFLFLILLVTLNLRLSCFY